MEKNNFWNEAAKYGAIIGALLSASFLLETALTTSGKLSNFVLLTVEFILVAGVHYYLLHRYTRKRSAAYSAEEGFTFGLGYSYILLLSGFAGVIQGLVQALYLHVVIGYGNYVDKYVASLEDLMNSGAVPPSAQASFNMITAQLQNAELPSFFSTFSGCIFSSLLFGAIFGLIIAGVLVRQSRPFDNNEVNQ